jgi:predicted GH43/DUF377 family glycosyl hydrolase
MKQHKPTKVPKARHMAMNQKQILWLILLLLASACRHDASPPPLKFRAYENNPIIVPGESGSYDDNCTLMPYAFKVDNVFYIFYDGWCNGRKEGICFATSSNGYHFTKYRGNPVFSPSDKGYDSYGTGSPVILKDDSLWVMYYNAGDIALFCPAPNVGRATARSLTGPWERDDKPVLTRGSKSEWDGDFILPTSILKLEDSTYRMYYSAGADFATFNHFYIGMASSSDGINWLKYNDPATSVHPFADSDPVMKTGYSEDPEYDFAWSGRVYSIPGGFEMYYTTGPDLNYASSNDGIHWEEYQENPVYRLTDDPFTAKYINDSQIEFSTIIKDDSACYMYYDYGNIVGKIGMATAKIRPPAADR